MIEDRLKREIIKMHVLSNLDKKLIRLRFLKLNIHLNITLIYARDFQKWIMRLWTIFIFRTMGINLSNFHYNPIEVMMYDYIICHYENVIFFS